MVLHSGTVIGSDGFGYAHDRQGRHLKRPHVGYVQIDDDVELGANVCVDRGTFGRTWIKRGAKIDNLVQVAHNVEIGEDSILVSQVGISGSTVLGDGVILGGKAAVSGHLRLGNRVTAAGKSGITSNLGDGEVVAGFPGHPPQEMVAGGHRLSTLARVAQGSSGIEEADSGSNREIRRSKRLIIQSHRRSDKFLGYGGHMSSTQQSL